MRFHHHFLGFVRRRGPQVWGMGSCAISGLGYEPGSGPETVRRARARTSRQPFPHGFSRDSCARPIQGSAQACFFPFFPAHGNAVACVGFGASSSLALGEVSSSFLA